MKHFLAHGEFRAGTEPRGFFRVVTCPTRRGFESLSCLLARANADGRFELLNPAWRCLGYDWEELDGRLLADLLEPEQARKIILALLDQAEGPITFHLVDRQGRRRRFRWYREFDGFADAVLLAGIPLRGEME